MQGGSGILERRVVRGECDNGFLGIGEAAVSLIVAPNRQVVGALADIALETLYGRAKSSEAA
jgi:hypothetical protein